MIGNPATRTTEDGSILLIERTSPFIDDPEILMDFIKSLDGVGPAVKRFLVVPKELFNLTDSIEIVSIDVSRVETK